MIVNPPAGPPWAGQRHTTGEDRRNREVSSGGRRGRLGPDDRVIVALLGLDLLLATVRPHAVGYREATAWSAFYITVAAVFGLVLATQAVERVQLRLLAGGPAGHLAGAGGTGERAHGGTALSDRARLIACSDSPAWSSSWTVA